MAKSKHANQKPGPKPDRLKLDEDDWEDAIGKALEKNRPPEGRPKHEKNEQDQQAPD